jgi:hypothetical protein
MKTLLRIAIVGVALMLFSEVTLAVNVRGDISCGIWVEERQKEARGGDYIGALVNQAWLIGFFSGQAAGSNKEFWGKQNVNILDVPSVLLWMDNYCRANPLKTVVNGADTLFEERTKGKK